MKDEQEYMIEHDYEHGFLERISREIVGKIVLCLGKIFEVNNGNCSLKWSLYILAIYKGIFIIFCIPQSFNW